MTLTTANYADFVIYYSDIAAEDTDLATTYGLSGAWTVVVPDPATWALFGGLGALGLAIVLRRK